jgi:hypothetical protein
MTLMLYGFVAFFWLVGAILIGSVAVAWYCALPDRHGPGGRPAPGRGNASAP